MELRMKPIYRALLTRSLAIVPSLACALIAGQAGSEQLIVLSSVVLSFQLPFALLPMIKFVGSPKVCAATCCAISSSLLSTPHLMAICEARTGSSKQENSCITNIAA